MKFGVKVRQLREGKGFSQKELGKLSDVAQNSIARYETGEQVPGFEVVQSLCIALGVHCDVFEGCDYEPAENKRGRGRPRKPATDAATEPKKQSKKGGNGK
jgi:transcriptional regulator with XRE-family HTH domain